jgi:hypothetical protein
MANRSLTGAQLPSPYETTLDIKAEIRRTIRGAMPLRLQGLLRHLALPQGFLLYGP